MAVGDFNNDSKPDLAVTVYGYNQSLGSGREGKKVSIFLGNGAGNFSAAPDVEVGLGPISVAVGDMNRDGNADLVVANFEGDEQHELGSLTIRLGRGDGTFPTWMTLRDGISRPTSVALADFNSNGLLDAAVATSLTDLVSVRLGNGTASILSSQSTGSRVGTEPVSVAVGDFNRDGKPDFAAANSGSDNVSVLLGEPGDSYPWISRGTVAVPGPTAVAVGDFDGDAIPDLAVTSADLNAVVVRLGGGAGYFGASPDVPVGSSPSALAVADFDGDFQADLAVTNASGTVSILLNQRLRNTQPALTVTSTAGTYPTPLELTTSGGSPGTGAATFTATNGTATGCAVSPTTPYKLSTTSAGTCSVTATKAGDVNYEPVSSVPTTVTFAASLPSLRINDAPVTEGNSGTVPATFTITRSGTTSGTSSVTWATANSSAAAGTDYVGVAPTSVSFGPGETTRTVSVTVNGDTLVEPAEAFLVNLSAPVGATIADASGVGTIVNDDSGLRINDATVTEGNSGTVAATFTITRSGATNSSTSVQWATANNTAAAGTDYVAVPATPLTFAAAETSKAVSVIVNGDTLGEATESFLVKLSSPTGATILDDTGVGTITNDDVSLSVNDVTVVEGNSGTKSATSTITRSGPTGASASVNWATANHTAVAGSDYVAVPPTTVTFAAGETSKTVSVTVNGDTLGEATEAFLVKLSSPVGGTIVDDTGVGTITADDAALSVNNVSLAEGNSGTKSAVFTITRHGPAGSTASVNWATANNTARAGTDYVAAPATTLTFAAGETFKTVSVTVNGDTQGESNESFFVKLSSPVGAAIMNDTGHGTILNDDTGLLINNVSVTEGNSGTKSATFTVSRIGPTGASSSVTWATANNTAMARTDYVAVPPTTLTFAAGETTKAVSVTVNGDTQGEINESFLVKLSSPVGAAIVNDTGVGTITNDDTALVVNDVTVTEGNSGTKSATFTVTRSGPTGASSSVTWSTANNTAAAGSDYVAVPPTVITFAAGETTKPVSVTVNGDIQGEFNESFFVKLTSPAGATLLDDTGVGTITNDDTALVVNNVTLAEGSSGSKSFTFTVSRLGPTTGASSVQWTTADNTALAGTDYVAVPLTPIDFAAGETTKTVSVTVNGDTQVEPNETFYVRLSSPVGATLLDGVGVGTITNDETAAAAAAAEAGAAPPDGGANDGGSLADG